MDSSMEFSRPEYWSVGSLSFLQVIFPTQGSNPGLLHCRWILYQLSYQGNPELLHSSVLLICKSLYEPNRYLTQNNSSKRKHKLSLKDWREHNMTYYWPSVLKLLVDKYQGLLKRLSALKDALSCGLSPLNIMAFSPAKCKGEKSKTKNWWLLNKADILFLFVKWDLKFGGTQYHFVIKIIWCSSRVFLQCLLDITHALL